MPKNVNLKLFNAVTIALFVFAVLFDSTAQGANPHEGLGYPINARVSGVTRTFIVPSDHYFANDVPNNLKTAKRGNSIYYIVLPGFDIPLDPIYFISALTAAHVDAYWDTVYKTSEGWSRGSRTATTSYNCHGHSSGRNKWMAIQPLLNDDYDERTTAEYMCVGAIYGGESADHTGKVEVTVDVNDNNGVLLGRGIVKISEKYAASAVYERVFYTITAPPPTEVIPIVGSPIFPNGTSPFYVKKP